MSTPIGPGKGVIFDKAGSENGDQDMRCGICRILRKDLQGQPPLPIIVSAYLLAGQTLLAG